MEKKSNVFLSRLAIIALIATIIVMISVLVFFLIYGWPTAPTIAFRTVDLPKEAKDVEFTKIVKTENETIYAETYEGDSYKIKVEPELYAKLHEGDSILVYQAESVNAGLKTILMSALITLIVVDLIPGIIYIAVVTSKKNRKSSADAVE